MTTRRWTLGLLALLVVAVAVGVARWRGGLRGTAPATPVAGAASAPAQPLQLAPTDVATARRGELVATLAVSGSLKAVDSAVVKARSPAELLQLSVREGDRVQAGQLIGRLDATDVQLRLRQAEDQVANAQAQLDIAQRTLRNNQALVDQGFISQTALDTSVNSAAAAQATLQAARAAADLARKAVRDTEVRAPLAGLVAQRLVQPGERLALDARIVEIVDLARIELEAAVAPEDVPALRVGQSARVQIDGLAQPVPARVAAHQPGHAGRHARRDGLPAAGARARSAPGPVCPRPGRTAAHHHAAGAGQRRAPSTRRGPTCWWWPAGARRCGRCSWALRGDVDFGRGTEAAVEVLAGVAEGDTVLRGSVGALREGTPLQLAATP